MSLQDLIRSVHSRDTFSSSIDLFLASSPQEDRAVGWHPSAFAGMCVRKSVLIKLLRMEENADSPSAKLRKIWDFGKSIHWIYQNKYLGPMGILWGLWKCSACGRSEWDFYPKSNTSSCTRKEHSWSYREIPLRALAEGLSVPIVGHCDGLIKLGGIWCVLELKSINHFGFQHLKEPYHAHWCQGQIYGELIRQKLILGFTGSAPVPINLLVVYINKNLSEERAFKSPLDGAKGRELLSLPKIHEDSLASKILPSRCDDCTSLVDTCVRKCSVGSYCFGTLSWDELVAKGARNG